MRKCDNCDKEYDEKVKGAIKKYCSKKCGRQDYYQTHWKSERKQNAEWYSKNRETEIAKNKEYREQNRELFDWYHDKNRFGGMREIILSRDNNECRGCQSKDNIVIHHKDETGETSLQKRKLKGLESNNDLENLITLCHGCHIRLHHWQRRNKVVLKQDEEIIKVLKELTPR